MVKLASIELPQQEIVVKSLPGFVQEHYCCQVVIHVECRKSKLQKLEANANLPYLSI
jgi:hypothetical protein